MNARILVVEDEDGFAEALVDVLDQLDYSVTAVASSGDEALAAAERARPDLALMDIQIKGAMDGIETATLLRKRFDIPVVFLTSHADEATLRRAKETEPHGYLIKPFNERDLRATIEVAMHKHAIEARLAERERWFSAVLTSIGEAVIATDRHERVMFINPVAEALTGRRRDEAAGCPVAEVLRLIGPDGQPLAPPVSEVLRSGHKVTLPKDTALLGRAGVSVAVDSSVAPILDERGAVSGAVVVFHDVTERKEMEARLALSERLASLGTMAAGVGHEINNPLSYVLLNLDFALDVLRRQHLGEEAPSGPTLSPALKRDLREVEEVLREAHQGARRVRDIVRALKKFSRTEDAIRTHLDLPDVLEEALRMTGNELRHRARLRRDYGVTPRVVANASLLCQVFVNLLINAGHAIAEGAVEHNEVCVRTFSDAEGRAVIEVTDTGSGITKADLPRIFDPFFTTKLVGAGTGLGLAISHRIVTDLGGTITAESDPGHGAVFRVALPPAPAPTSATSEKPPEPSIRPTRRGRVLVIDDEESVARSIERVLRNDHDVAVETDARAALARVNSGEEYDVIFCDLMMPVMTGWDFYEALTAVRPSLAGRVVFVTGGTLSSRSSAFFAEHANVCLSKPCSAQTLRRIAADFVR